MTLDEAIKDFEETVEECNRVADTQKFDEGDSVNNWYRKKADYSQQVTEWLKKLKVVKQIITQHDSDRMPEDYWYIDKIREVVREAEDDKN